jgi:AhpD family alkylhydroperoxidase
MTRMSNPALVLPDAKTGIDNIYKAIYKGGVDPIVLELVHLRASQVNGCAACVYFGVPNAKKHGETDQRLHALATWRESEQFSESERAALALTEAATHLDPTDPVPAPVWDEAAKHFDEPGLAALVLMIGLSNLFNRVNLTVREPEVASWA